MSQGRILTAGAPLSTQWDQISARLLAASFSPDMRESFRDWRRRADALRIRRDDVIHTIWWPTGGSDSPYWAIDELSRPLVTRFRRMSCRVGRPPFVAWRMRLPACASISSIGRRMSWDPSRPPDQSSLNDHHRAGPTRWRSVAPSDNGGSPGPALAFVGFRWSGRSPRYERSALSERSHVPDR